MRFALYGRSAPVAPSGEPVELNATLARLAVPVIPELIGLTVSILFRKAKTNGFRNIRHEIIRQSQTAFFFCGRLRLNI